ncbi:MAG: SdiA-regulated domain-containing protein [Pseudomonadota bacterium]
MRTALALLAGLSMIAAACARPTAPEGAGEVQVRLGAKAPLQWTLPDGLREISGLALDAQQRLFAIDDEQAVVYEIDYEDGGIRRRFAVGNPVLRGDFEGLAAVGETLYALTSDGVLLRFAPVEDGATTVGARRDTGLGKRCEFEGLAYDRQGDALLLACKRVLERGRKREVRLYRWSLAGDDLTSSSIDEDILAAAVGTEDFQPSAVAIDRRDGSLWLLAARQQAVARLAVDASGRLTLLEAQPLPFASLHRQSEGLALAEDGLVMIADEGGKQRGRLARYGRR